MHMTIMVIVHAKDEEEALKKGENALDKITKEGNLFDSYSTLEGEEIDDVWGSNGTNLPGVLLASSPEGQHFIEVGWRLTVKAFMDALERVKLAIEYLTPVQIMEESLPPHLPMPVIEKIYPHIRYNFYKVGDQVGDHTKNYLFFENEPITSERNLEFARNPQAGLKAYLIPADIHY